MSGPEILVPISICLGGCAMVFGIVYMKSRENMAMIEKGMNPKEHANRPAPFRSLKNGLLFLGAGLGLFLAYLVDTYASRPGMDNPAGLYFSLIAIGGGVGLIISYVIEKKHWLDKTNDQ
jgi:dipeptide/tripeptide permease